MGLSSSGSPNNQPTEPIKNNDDLQPPTNDTSALASPDYSFTGSGLSLSSLSCPNCGDTLNVLSDNPKVVSCGSCGSQVDMSDKKVIGRTNPKKNPPWSHLRLGMTGNIKTVEYQIVGRIRYNSTDGYHWDEWMLLSRKGKIKWLTEDTGKFFFLEAWTPETDVDLEYEWHQKFIKWDGRKAIVYDKGIAHIGFVEGELSWRATVGEEIRYLDAKRGKTKICCEKEEDEIKFFKGLYYTPDEIYAAFSIDEIVPEIPYEYEDDIDEDDYTLNWDRVPDWITDSMKLCMLFGSIFLIAYLVLHSSGYRMSETAVAGSMQNAGVGIVSPVFELKKAGATYIVQSNAGLQRAPVNEAWCQVTLLDADNNDEPVIIFENDFWFEMGREYEDGQWYDWAEADSQHQEWFRLDKPGRYKLQIEGESANQNNSLSAAIYANARDASYFAYSGGFLLVLGFLLMLGASYSYKERNDIW